MAYETVNFTCMKVDPVKNSDFADVSTVPNIQAWSTAENIFLQELIYMFGTSRSKIAVRPAYVRRAIDPRGRGLQRRSTISCGKEERVVIGFDVAIRVPSSMIRELRVVEIIACVRHLQRIKNGLT